MEFSRLSLQEEISIRQLVSFHYFEYAKGYIFDGEAHDFWELLYVDKGEVQVRAGERFLELRQGQIVFHKPNEFHTVSVHQRHRPPNLVVISYECESPAMNALREQSFSLGDHERNLLSKVMKEGFQTFCPPLDDPSSHALIRNSRAPFASEQMMKAYLEILLITLVRKLKEDVRSKNDRLSPTYKENNDGNLALQIIEYMKDHISEPLTVDAITGAFHLGRSQLNELIRSRTGMGVLKFYKRLRIEQAKTMIRENRSNNTEIAERLGYNGIHYFSRDFKKMTGMSPSEYAKTVKARIKS